MSTEIIRESAFPNRLAEKSVTWLRLVREKFLNRKKYLIVSAAGLAVAALAAYYFWGGQASAAQY